jgi:hypothetical protein
MEEARESAENCIGQLSRWLGSGLLAFSLSLYDANLYFLQHWYTGSI